MKDDQKAEEKIGRRITRSNSNPAGGYSICVDLAELWCMDGHVLEVAVVSSLQLCLLELFCTCDVWFVYLSFK